MKPKKSYDFEKYLLTEDEACYYLSIGRNTISFLRQTNQLDYLLTPDIKYRRKDLERLAEKFSKVSNGKPTQAKIILPTYGKKYTTANK